jgi:hypothetical protein
VDRAGVVVVQAQPELLIAEIDADLEDGDDTVPDLTEPEKQRDLVSAAILSSNVSNEYLTGEDWGTDWVFTFPGRYAYREVLTDSTIDALTVAYGLGNPFDTTVTRSNGEGCVPVDVSGIQTDRDGNTYAIYGREEESATSEDIDFSPGTFEGFALCFEVNVIGVNDPAAGGVGPSATLQSRSLYKQLVSPFTFGWVNAGLTQRFRSVEAAPSASLDTVPGDMIGLPFIGFAAITDNRTEVKRGGAFAHNLKRGENLAIAPEEPDVTDVCEREFCSISTILATECTTFLTACLAEEVVNEEECVAGALLICEGNL